ncbi:MAG: hypothetical protein KJ970_07460 [Candidatus Eisenbacteria bacterium]|uniref:Uncharacterized protein n=1 Tax=Eiseniibacteriota bacterium TaxID=2212470 RepID=A0A948RVI8_UNCEI|nr:hypothetical protein [Candidatus Eisenbacteria bacterium]MBU1949587.1 hypothetical protein [Candidatus Eisenbacteria bacterium]MBU2690751.1 hypothetical protein [Candidatus Eisenbacteria bacterium]
MVRSLTLLLIVFCMSPATHLAAQNPAAALGSRDEGAFLPDPGRLTICPESAFLRNDDQTFENAVSWQHEGVSGGPQYYGAWAEGYTASFVCGIQLVFAQVGEYTGATIDIYIWDSDTSGFIPVPGNVICYFPGVHIGTVAQYPNFSTYEREVCCDVGGLHFVGFWPNWPGAVSQFSVGADEDGAGEGMPRTKISPSTSYPSGWQLPNVVPIYESIVSLGIREYSGGNCGISPTVETSWGAIKSLY